MLRRTSLTAIVWICVAVGGPLARAELVLSGEGLWVEISNDSQYGSGIDRLTGLDWGLHENRSAASGPSTIDAQYDLTLHLPDVATIEIGTQQICANPTGNRPRCTTSGRLILTPSVSTRVFIDLTFDYRLTGYPTSNGIGVDVYDASNAPTFVRVFRASETADAFLDPREGTLTIADEMTMLPGIPYWIQFSMLSDGAANVPSPDPATGNGLLRVEFQPFELQMADLNCDTSVDGRDIFAFSLLLTDSAIYHARYAGCRGVGDVNSDGAVDQWDIAPFVEAVLRG